MKPLIACAVVLLLILGWLAIRARQNRELSRWSANPSATYLGLRTFALQDPHIEPGKAGEPSVVLMDLTTPRGARATVAAYADGTASIYLSNGGGFLGGGQAHESIRKAAIQTVEIAGELKGLMHPTTEYPLPQQGQVTFYVRTDDQVLTATAPEEDLRSHRSPLYKLGNSAQAIITEYRLTEGQK